MLREVLKHPIEHVIQVEIDQAVVDMAKEYLPNHSAGSYNDPRLNLVIADGMDFVRASSERFDIIISDSTDPIGPGEILFTENFYAAAKQCLNEGGIMATQNGVPFFQPDELRITRQRMAPHFEDMGFYCAPVPTYYGGFMAFAWGTDTPSLRDIDRQLLQRRYSDSGITTRYYNPAIHSASFALPQYMIDALNEAS